MTIPSLVSIRLVVWGAGIALAIICAQSVALWAMNVELKRSATKLKSVQVDMRDCKNRITDFKRDVAVQNDRIEGLQAEHAKKAAQAAQELAQAEQRLRAVQARVDNFSTAQRRPTPSGATCRTADIEIREALKK